MPTITVQYTDGRATEHPINGAEVVIGRDASCEIPLEDTITSRRHARVYRDGTGVFWLQDLRSKNGTVLNSTAITTPTRLRDKDRIVIGACLLTFHASAAGPKVVLSESKSDTTYASTSAWGSDQRLVLPQMRLEKLYELNGRMTGRFDRDDLLNEVLEICIELLRFERAGVALWKGGTALPEWVKLKNLKGEAGNEFRISRSVVDRSLHSGERVLINDTAAEADPTMSMISNNIRSAMCVPIQYHQQVHGVIYGDRVTTAGGYSKEDADFFAALGQLAAMGLVNVKLVEEIKNRQRTEMDLQTAREIQSRLFPAEPLNTGALIIDALNDPGRSVSGDYYDYFVRPDGLITVVIADVSGKGTPASLLMANLQAAVHVTLNHETDLARATDALNKLICRNVSNGRFITAMFGLLDPANEKFTYINAGHLPPYIVRPSGITKFEVDPSLPLGIEDSFVYESFTADLSAGPLTLFMYTDGVPDAENEDGKPYGMERLEESLKGNLAEQPAEMIARVRRSIKQFTRNHTQTDDITIVAMRLN